MKKNRGFTLIEILIVLVIIGILAAIAVPAYNSQLRKGTRAAAQAVMADMANKELFYLQTQRQYTSLYTDLGIAVLPSEVDNFYTITITPDNTATPPTFAIKATPKTGTRQEPDGWIQMTNTNAKTSQYLDKW